MTHARRILQIAKKHQALALAGKRVEVLNHADGSLKMLYQGKSLTFAEVAA